MAVTVVVAVWQVGEGLPGPHALSALNGAERVYSQSASSSFGDEASADL